MPTIRELREKWEKANAEKEFDRRLGLMTDVVMRQSTVTEKAARQLLEDTNFNVEDAVMRANGVAEQEPVKRTLTQNLFSEFRTFLDEAATNHARRIEHQRARVSGVESAERGCRGKDGNAEEAGNAARDQMPGSSVAS